ncbi:hypothetical protein BpHYR1_000122 [Brachionus plicatilis]|uniref:Uncharacterized protein n=1 Tax=Brachionus plicatilis TaxID=10195 RepID=A0A3M7S8H1_BRAPC|nr:hypothetical protein BpHYR1_000122 [Brachionus plicatilis]
MIFRSCSLRWLKSGKSETSSLFEKALRLCCEWECCMGGDDEDTLVDQSAVALVDLGCIVSESSGSWRRDRLSCVENSLC